MLTGILHVACDCHVHLKVLTGRVLQVQDIVGTKDLAQSEKGENTEHKQNRLEGSPGQKDLKPPNFSHPSP